MGGSGQERATGSERSAPITVTDPEAPAGIRTSVIEATAAAANESLADAERQHRELLVIHTSDTPPTSDDCNLWSFQFRSDPLLGAAVLDGNTTSEADGSVPSVDRLAARLRHGYRVDANTNTGAGAGVVVIVRVSALIEVGGFDPTMPGLGLADITTRVAAAGWRLHGIDHRALPFVDSLHRHLDVADWFRSEARWLQLHGTHRDRGRNALKVFADRTKAALDRVGGPASLQADAERQWQGAAAHEVQEGIGHRADWRFLLPAGRRDHTLIIDADPERLAWLVDDGWTGRLSTRPTNDDPADVVLVGPDQEIVEAAAMVGPEGTICVLRSRKPLAPPGRGAGRAEADELVELGFDSTRRYLALPDLHRPKRFIPLDHDGGLAWLSSTGPPDRVGGLSRANTARRRLARLAGREVARLAGDIVVVGHRGTKTARFAPAGLDQDRLPPATSDVILLTSGFDEGSRAVLLPLIAGAERPQAVVKISSRPAYNQNVDREAELITTLSSQVTRPGLLPESSGTFDVGALRGSTETYAGRWSGSDVLNEQGSLDRRSHVLDLVAGAINDLGEQTMEDRLVWSADAFDEHIGHWLDRLEQTVEPSATLGALRSRLRERSELLQGSTIPLVRRHYDLGPWNVVFNESVAGPNASPVTIVDWELAPPRSGAEPGLAGADLLYFVKYWLHIAMDVRSADDELSAFPFLCPPGLGSDPRFHATDALGSGLGGLGVDRAFVPLLAAHVWSEAASYTMERRKRHGGDPGSPYRYLLTLARLRHRLFAAWPLKDDTTPESDS